MSDQCVSEWWEQWVPRAWLCLISWVLPAGCSSQSRHARLAGEAGQLDSGQVVAGHTTWLGELLALLGRSLSRPEPTSPDMEEESIEAEHSSDIWWDHQCGTWWHRWSTGPLVLPDWWAADYSFRLISRQQAELPSHMATPSADTLLAPHCGLITNLMGLNLVSWLVTLSSSRWGGRAGTTLVIIANINTIDLVWSRHSRSKNRLGWGWVGPRPTESQF